MLSKESTCLFLINAVDVPKIFDWFCRLLNSLNIPLSVETVCVFTAPIFSANASWATYLLTKVLFFPLPEALVLTLLVLIQIIVLISFNLP